MFVRIKAAVALLAAAGSNWLDAASQLTQLSAAMCTCARNAASQSHTQA